MAWRGGVGALGLAFFLVFLGDMAEDEEAEREEEEEAEMAMDVGCCCGGAVAFALVEKSKRMEMSSKSLVLAGPLCLGEVPAPVTAPTAIAAGRAAAACCCCCCCCSSSCSLSGCIPLPTEVEATEPSAEEVE